MSSQLRTVASFDVAYKADLARNILEEAGIMAHVIDREVVSMEWLLGAAINGVKVQVSEDQMERAEAILEERFAGDLQPFAEGVNDEELARQALESAPEDDETSRSEVSTEPTPSGEVESSARSEGRADVAEPSERDQYARRFLFAAVCSIVLVPLWFYGLYLLLNAMFGRDRLSRQGRWHIALGLLAGVFAAVILLTIPQYGCIQAVFVSPF